MKVPFEVICIDNSPHIYTGPSGRKYLSKLEIGKKYIVEAISKGIAYKIQGIDYCESIGGVINPTIELCPSFDPSRFRLLPPSYENISKELAKRAMEVGDGQDLKPVRKEVEV